MVGIIGILVNFAAAVLFVLGGNGGNTFLMIGSAIVAIIGGSCCYSALEDADACLWRIALFVNLAFAGVLLLAGIVLSFSQCVGC